MSARIRYSRFMLKVWAAALAFCLLFWGGVFLIALEYVS